MSCVFLYLELVKERILSGTGQRNINLSGTDHRKIVLSGTNQKKGEEVFSSPSLLLSSLALLL